AGEDVLPGLEDADLVLEGNIDVAPAPEKKKPAPPPPPPPKLKPLGRPPAGKPAAEPPRVKPVVPKRPSASNPASGPGGSGGPGKRKTVVEVPPLERSEEHTSELQSRGHLVCRLLLEKKKDRAHALRQRLIRG